LVVVSTCTGVEVVVVVVTTDAEPQGRVVTTA